MLPPAHDLNYWPATVRHGPHVFGLYCGETDRSTLTVLSIVLYLLGVLGVIGEGFQGVSHYAYWLALLGWLAMTVGVAFKGI